MALPPKAHFEARAAAAHHVQVEIVEVGPLTSAYGRVRVTGRVVAVFRQRLLRRPVLQQGDLVSFSVGAFSADSIGGPPGAGVWLPITHVTAGRFVEVYLNGDPPQCETARVEYTLIDAPSQRAQLPMSRWVWHARTKGVS